VELPSDFPEELRAHLEAVFRILRDLAERHNAKAVNPLSLASVLMGNNHKPLVKAAYAFSSWADDQAQRRKDVVSGYRNWLDKTDELAGIEKLDGATNANGNGHKPARVPNIYDEAVARKAAEGR
jgi:hypothetical protein